MKLFLVCRDFALSVKSRGFGRGERRRDKSPRGKNYMQIVCIIMVVMLEREEKKN